MNRIRELRKGKKLTQAKLCDNIKIAQPTLSGYENGVTEPDNETLFKIADFFGVSVDYLLGRDSEQQEKTPPVELTEGEKNLMDLIVQLTDEETQELSNFVDYILSKRKQ